MDNEGKTYYWIKLKTDFFDIPTIDWLQEQRNGCEYIVLYQKLCLLTANSDGELIRVIGTMIVPYDAKKIAETTKFKYDTVVVALELYKKIGLIIESDTGILKIPGISDMIGSETKWAQKKRIQRGHKKDILLPAGKTSQGTSAGQGKDALGDIVPMQSANVSTETGGNQEDNCGTLSDKSLELRVKSLEIRDKSLEIEQKAKPKKSLPKINYAEFVSMTEQEHQSLIDDNGQEGVAWMIERLDNYKGSSGKKYKSDYRAILSWVAGEWVKNKETGKPKTYAERQQQDDIERRKWAEEIGNGIRKQNSGDIAGSLSEGCIQAGGRSGKEVHAVDDKDFWDNF